MRAKALSVIEGIGPGFEEKLKAAGVDSCQALLTKGATAQGRKEISAATGIDDSRLLRFVNHADLMRIKGVGGEYAELLEASGVDSVLELAQRNPANLSTTMKQLNTEKSLVRLTPGSAQVADWVEQAKTLPPIISH